MFWGFSSPASNLNPFKGLLSLRKFYSLVLLSRLTFIRFYCATILVLVSLWVSVLSALVARQWENLTIYWLCIDKFLPFPIGQLTMLLQQVVLGFLNKKKNGHRIIESCFKRFLIIIWLISEHNKKAKRVGVQFISLVNGHKLVCKSQQVNGWCVWFDFPHRTSF